MLQTLTRSEMLKLWRKAAGLEPLRADCTVERVEGLDADAVIEPRMRAWYLHLLDTAPPGLLPIDDVAGDIVLAPCVEHAAATGMLPERARRLLEIRVTGWNNPAQPCTVADAQRRCALALNPYSAPGASHPMCVCTGRRIHVCPIEDGDIVHYALAVVDTGPDCYVLDESLVSMIPDVFSESDNLL